MSYCRWSTDDFGCDLYCYADCSGGYTTHVASRRIIGDVPKAIVPPLGSGCGDIDVAAWADSYRRQTDFVMTAKREAINLPHAGDTFNDPTLTAFRERLMKLRALGYRFPDDVLAEIDEEIAGQAGEADA